MTIQCPITVTVTAPAPVTPTISAACEAWIASRGIDLNAVTSDDVFAAFSAVNSGVIDYACGQVIAAAYQAPPTPIIQYAAPDGSTSPGTPVCAELGVHTYPATITSWLGGNYRIFVTGGSLANMSLDISPQYLRIGVC